MREFSEEFLDELRHLIQENNETQVMAELKELHPADIAELIQRRRSMWCRTLTVTLPPTP